MSTFSIHEELLKLQEAAASSADSGSGGGGPAGEIATYASYFIPNEVSLDEMSVQAADGRLNGACGVWRHCSPSSLIPC
jgi:hypothetical protein